MNCMFKLTIDLQKEDQTGWILCQITDERGDHMKRSRDKIYYAGVVITVLSWAGLAESFTGHGSTFWSIVWLVIGFAMVLTGYIK